MVEVRKREKETSESLIKRFSRRVQQSGILLRARKSRFREEEKTKRQMRESALYRARLKKEVDKLKKMGKFNEENFRRIKKKLTDLK